MVEVIHPVSRIAEAVVGGQEVRRSVVGGVVHHATRARRKSALHDEGHAALFRRPCRAFRTVDVDVACPAVAKGAPLDVVAVRPATEQTVPLNNLVENQRGHGVEVHRLSVFHNQFFSEDDSCGQAPPSFLVAVVQGTQNVCAVGIVQKELASFGHVVLAEADGHAGGAWGVHNHAPHLVALLEGPSAVLVARPCDVVLHAKPPWGFFVTVCDFVFLRQAGAIEGRKHRGCRQILGVERCTAVGDLGLDGGRSAQQGQRQKQGWFQIHG